MGAVERLRRSARYRSGRWLQVARRLYFRAVAGAFPGAVSLPPPVYIVGCQSSGKTTLAALLRQHPQMLVLTEPVLLWADAYPVTFVDARGSGPTRSRLALTAEDHEPVRTQRLRHLLWLEMQLAGRQCLVDESPWYSFRIEFLRSIFPPARFLHIIRDGVEVARVIEDRCRGGALWGRRPRLWEIITDYAHASERYRNLTNLCRNDFERGLLLWRMTVEATRAAARNGLPADQYLEVRAEQWTDRPQQTCLEVSAFLGVELDDAGWESAARQILTVSVFKGSAAPQTTRTLAGELLEELGYW